MRRVGGSRIRWATYTHMQTQLLLSNCKSPWHEHGTDKVAPCQDSTPQTSPAFLPFLGLIDSVDGDKHQEQSEISRLTFACLAHHRCVFSEATWSQFYSPLVGDFCVIWTNTTPACTTCLCHVLLYKCPYRVWTASLYIDAYPWQTAPVQ